MNIIPLLSTIIVVATAATIVFALVSFVLFRLRERRVAAPAQGIVNGQLVGEPQFFRVYRES